MSEDRSQMTEVRNQMNNLHAQSAEQTISAEKSDLPSVVCHLYSVTWIVPKRLARTASPHYFFKAQYLKKHSILLVQYLIGDDAF